MGHRLPESVNDPVFRNLLIADSGKGNVEEMVRMLRYLPAFQRARLNLLHVVSEQGDSSVQEHWQEATGLLAEAVNRLGVNPGDVNTIIRQGDTKQTVLKVAEELNSDLIVMGSRGLGRLQSILSNSASQYVFQLSTRPMLLVRDDLYVRHINRLLVTIDGTGVGDDALRLACEMVREIPGGSLAGVHVSRQDITPSRGGRNPADEVLEKAVQRARSFGVDLQPIHRTGDVGRAVCAAASECNADLLLIASQDRRPLVARGLVDLDRLLGSSVSDYIRVHAPAPVLLVREPESKG
jgi:nucleotide-binding universal stress UspA family protein